MQTTTADLFFYGSDGGRHSCKPSLRFTSLQLHSDGWRRKLRRGRCPIPTTLTVVLLTSVWLIVGYWCPGLGVGGKGRAPWGGWVPSSPLPVNPVPTQALGPSSAPFFPALLLAFVLASSPVCSGLASLAPGGSPILSTAAGCPS